MDEAEAGASLRGEQLQCFGDLLPVGTYLHGVFRISFLACHHGFVCPLGLAYNDEVPRIASRFLPICITFLQLPSVRFVLWLGLVEMLTGRFLVTCVLLFSVPLIDYQARLYYLCRLVSTQMAGVMGTSWALFAVAVFRILICFQVVPSLGSPSIMDATRRVVSS